MAPSIATSMGVSHRFLLDEPVRSMAKADLKNLEKPDFQAEIGKGVARARLLVGWSKKELAAEVRKDEAQISRWESGKERPQFDALWSVPSMRGPLVIALAELSGQIEVNTVLQIRRIA